MHHKDTNKRYVNQLPISHACKLNCASGCCLTVVLAACSLYKCTSDITDLQYQLRDRGSSVVKVLCYRSEGRWFDPSWCQWIFH